MKRDGPPRLLSASPLGLREAVSRSSEDVLTSHPELLHALGGDGVFHFLQRVVAALGTEHASGLPRHVPARQGRLQQHNTHNSLIAPGSNPRRLHTLVCVARSVPVLVCFHPATTKVYRVLYDQTGTNKNERVSVVSRLSPSTSDRVERDEYTTQSSAY